MPDQDHRPNHEHRAVVGIFHDRDQLEQGIEQLQSFGINGAQISLLTTRADVEAALEGEHLDAPEEAQKRPVDRSELGNLQGLVGSIPAYLGAVLAAGVTVASGGTLAGVAIAALAGGIGGGAVGAGAATYLTANLDQDYNEHLERGGILALVWLAEPEQRDRVHAILSEFGATDIRDYTADADPAAPRLQS
jgi:hypothetical protein